MPRSGRRSMHRIAIVDKSALSEVLEALAQREGSQVRAAKLVGLSQSAYWRIAAGERASMSFDTYARLVDALGSSAVPFGRRPDPVLGFAAKPSDMQVERLMRQEAVEREEAEREVSSRAEAEALDVARLHRLLESSVRTEGEEFVWSHWEWWIEQQIVRYRPRAEPVVKQLWDSAQFRPELARFLEQVGRAHDRLPGERDLRCWLALYRALAPLGDDEATWGVEGGWTRMLSKGTLDDYLRMSLRREALLLDPARDVDLVRRGNAPESFADWLGRHEIEEGGTRPLEQARFLDELGSSDIEEE